MNLPLDRLSGVLTRPVANTKRNSKKIWRESHLVCRKSPKLIVAVHESAGRMYDKFVTFVDHLKDVGKRIEQSDRAYQSAMNSLCEGKGNLVKRSLDLKELGIKTSKELPTDLSERSQLSSYAVSSDKQTDDGSP